MNPIEGEKEKSYQADQIITLSSLPEEAKVLYLTKKTKIYSYIE